MRGFVAGRRVHAVVSLRAYLPDRSAVDWPPPVIRGPRRDNVWKNDAPGGAPPHLVTLRVHLVFRFDF